MAGMPKVRIGAAVSPIDGMVYVFGGDETGGGPMTAIVYRYDPERDSWEILPDMPDETFHGAHSAEHFELVTAIQHGESRKLTDIPHDLVVQGLVLEEGREPCFSEHSFQDFADVTEKPADVTAEHVIVLRYSKKCRSVIYPLQHQVRLLHDY